MPAIRKMDAFDAARAFVRDFVKTGRQWDVGTLECYLPRGLRFHPDTTYAGPATITDLAQFIRDEAH